MPTCLHGWGSDGIHPSGCPQCAEIGRQRDKEELARLRLLMDAATSFQFGDYHVEHLVDTDGQDYGWIISKGGKWVQAGHMTRDEAITQARKMAGL